MNEKSVYETIIGLEVHAQLKTASKIFCDCSTNFGEKPNSQVCPVCLGMPGVLPVLNRKAVDFAIKLGIATHSRISQRSMFARKNYFYPDLPKGYQITQYDSPLCEDGYLEIEIDGRTKKIGIMRIHLEEDAGKSIHAEKWVHEDETLIDFNRSGVPLVEIVTYPEIRSPAEAYHYLTRLRQLLLYLQICDGSMEKGSLRCDANISVRRKGERTLGVKTELKNMNSFRSVEKALQFERERQVLLLQEGEAIQPATLLWDENENIAVPMRGKETEHDYRYFPEPDLVTLKVDQAWIETMQQEIPELPLQRRNRFMSQYKITRYDADVLTEDKSVADYFEQVATHVSDNKLVARWITGEVLHVMKKEPDRETMPLPATLLAELLNLIVTDIINETTAKKIFKEMIITGKSPKEIVEAMELAQLSNIEALQEVVDKVVEAHPGQVAKYRAGKSKLFDFFMGQIMQETGGRANPKLVKKLLRNKLSAF